MILCDTNILIEIYRGNHSIVEVVKQIRQENMAVSEVTCAELLYGARDKKEIQIIRKDLNNLIVLPIQTSISNLAVRLVETYALSHKLALPDALIASTAIIHNMQLYTLNTKDFIFLKDVSLYDQSNKI